MFYPLFTNSPYMLATGRGKELDPTLQESFLDFAKSLGLTEDDVIVTYPTGNVQ